MSRLLKTPAIVFVLLAFFVSCATQRRCLEKFPIVESTIVKDSIVYRDTTLFVQLPADTVTDSIQVVLPCPQPPAFKTPKVRTSTRYASAEAWLAGDHLKVRLMLNDTLIAFVVDSAVAEKMKTVTITQAQTVREKFIPLIYKVALFVSIGFLVLAIIKVIITSLK